MRKLGVSMILICLLTTLLSCAVDRSDPKLLFNPERSLQVEIAAEAYKNNWKQLDSDMNTRLRLSYAPGRDLTREVIIAFDIMTLFKTSMDIPLVEFSQDICNTMIDNYIYNNDLILLSDDVSVQEVTIGEFPAAQYDNRFMNPISGQELHLSIIVIKGSRHYIVLDILCNRESYNDDRSNAFWPVIETICEMPVG